jgi:hypothetical protein
MAWAPIASMTWKKKTAVKGPRLISLERIDLCIRMFKTDYDSGSIAPKGTFDKSPAVHPKGAGSRKALEILRETGEAFTAPD